MLELLYKQYNQETLDHQYKNRLHVPEFADYFPRWESLSRETTKQFPVVEDIPYGTLPRERLDIIPSFQPAAKVLVFIHGGYWQMLDKAMFRFIANSLYIDGITTILLNYPLAPEASMDQIVASCRNALIWVYRNVNDYNGDRDQIYVAGHSAGGHLAAMLMTTEWKLKESHVSPNLLKGGLLISGLFNLVPIQLSYLNQVLQMDPAAALSNSPVNLMPVDGCTLVVAVGDAETDEFKAQSNELWEAWKYQGVPIKLLPLPALNHFSIVETVANSNSALYEALLELMKIKI